MRSNLGSISPHCYYPARIKYSNEFKDPTYVRVRILHDEISENDELERGKALICALYEK